jgi:hypothetical protein
MLLAVHCATKVLGFAAPCHLLMGPTSLEIIELDVAIEWL